MNTLPELALSVRQPWAWAIVHAGKNIENRSWNRRMVSAHGALLDFRGPVCIHAGKGMTQDEYHDDGDFIQRTACQKLPPPHELLRGGIIGTVTIVDVVRKSHSPWFFGTVGLVLADARPVDFIPCAGQLGYFKWTATPEGAADPPKRWMLPPGARPETPAEKAAHQGNLLE